MTNYKDKSMAVEIIGVARSCFAEKFGIPRQSGLAPSAEAVVELVGKYNREEMVRGLTCYSHIWLQFLFHGAVGDGWKTTVRPPRLGGQKRVGVFATRSPHRPNHIGLSAVRLEGVSKKNGTILIDVSGVDLLDGTPIIDIKPYISYSDSIRDAEMSLNWEKIQQTQVEFLPEAEEYCREYEKRTGRDLIRLISEILKEDPRPASQRETKKEFGMCLWDVNIRWSASEQLYTIISCGDR